MTVFVTTHVLAGAALGAVTRRPLLALPLGVASHLALDAVPHWGAVAHRTFLVVAVVDGLAGLAAMALVARAAPAGLRYAVLAGAVGASAPDLDKPAELFLGVQPYPAAVASLHGAVQRESAGWWWVEALAVVASALAVALLLRRARRDRRDSSPAGRRGTGAAGCTTTGPSPSQEESTPCPSWPWPSAPH